MKYESAKTAKGNVGVSFVSQEAADMQAAEMDGGRCVNCYDCTSCTFCTSCTSCTFCTFCTSCTSCTFCTSCTSCTFCTSCASCASCIGILQWTATPAEKLIAINGLRWPVATDGVNTQIGCQQHSVAQWAAFTDDAITAMDKDALAFWREFKPTILAMAAYAAARNGEQTK